MTRRTKWLGWLAVVALSGCGESHTAEACGGGDPPGCQILAGSAGCCGDRVTSALCDEAAGRWYCPSGSVSPSECATGPACEGLDSGTPCAGTAPSCWGGTAGGCCGDVSTNASCASGSWTCPSGTVPESECVGFGPTCGLTDGGVSPFPSDAGPVACGENLGPYQCLNQGCVPFWDDACCSTCDPSGGCADCQDFVASSCQPSGTACAGTTCDQPAGWACDPVTPDCRAATATDLDSCSVRGCVPSYPSAEGEPSIDDAVCVPVHRDVCRFACRRVAPPCPTGMVPEGDGFCYTDRCIPAFVCADTI